VRLAILLATLLLGAATARAQFKSTVPLVIAPTSVTDAKGHYVDGLTAQDLVLYDNDMPQPMQMEWTKYPIDLVVAIQTSSNSGAVLDKLGGSGILATQLIAAEAGETAVLSFSDEVKLHQDFTGNPDLVSHALRMLRKEGDDAHMLDALRQAAVMLQRRPLDRRRIILMIAEERDRSSAAKLDDVVEQVERVNAAVYWLTFSPFLEPFTRKAMTAEDLKPIDQRVKTNHCAPNCGHPDNTAVPQDVGPGSPVYALGELFRLHKPDLADLFARTTGGDTLSFLKKDALEQSIHRIGAEVHSQYILSFQPKTSDSGKFHTIRVVVKDRPDWHVRTRAGYWALE
jgi:VWFA-related protein